MPNYKITYNVQKEIIHRAEEYAQRTVNYAQANFPITTATLQTLVLPDDQVSDLRRLANAGINTIEKYNQVRLAFLREILPGIARGLVIIAHLPERIFVARSTYYGMTKPKYDIDEAGYLVPDLSRLDAEEIKSLTFWVNRVVRAKRLKELTDATVSVIVDKYIPTASHMHALWPGLASLAQDAETRGSGRRTQPLPWKDRLRNPTRSLKRYKPDPDVIAHYGKRIYAADVVLTQGALLEPYNHPDKTIRAIAEHHEALPTDPVWDVNEES